MSITDFVKLGTPVSPIPFEAWLEAVNGGNNIETPTLPRPYYTEADFRSCFEVVTCNGKTQTALEALYEDQYKRTTDCTTGRGDPLLVDPEVWNAALELKAASIADANRQQPGCIYNSPEIVAWIQSQTLTAAHDPDQDRRKEAQKALQKLIPSYKTTATWASNGAYRKCYRDVSALRMASRHLTRYEMKLVFPEISEWPKEWLDAVSKSDLETKRPREAAGYILGQLIQSDGFPLLHEKTFSKGSGGWMKSKAKQGKKRAALRMALAGKATAKILKHLP